MPASTPGPMTDTSRSAQISELIERDDTMTSSAAGRISVALGVVFRAARNATGTAGTSAASVPSVAMLSVSHSGRQSRAVYAQRGGNMREARSAPWTGASQTKVHIVWAEIACQEATTTAVPPSQPRSEEHTSELQS